MIDIHSRARNMEVQAERFRSAAKRLAKEKGLMQLYRDTCEMLAKRTLVPDIDELVETTAKRDRVLWGTQDILKSAIASGDTEVERKCHMVLVSALLHQAHEVEMAAAYCPPEGALQ